jgi:hypothetical protein
MSLGKLCLYAMLATILAFVAASKKSGVTQAKLGPSALTLTTNFPVQSDALPADFPLVQFNNSKSLGAGKMLVASRNLGDPNFAKTVILLVRYDA